MRFTVQNICWLTVVVAIASFLARSLDADVSTVVFVFVSLAYGAAPVLLALVSSFFQSVSARKRAVVGYYVLLMVGGVPTLLLLIVSPAGALLFAGLTCMVWIIQFEIYSSIHENQENRGHKARRKAPDHK